MRVNSALLQSSIAQSLSDYSARAPLGPPERFVFRPSFVAHREYLERADSHVQRGLVLPKADPPDWATVVRSFARSGDGCALAIQHSLRQIR